MPRNTLKAWLIRKTRSLFGIDDLRREAAAVAFAANELVRQLQSLAEQWHSHQPPFLAQLSSADAGEGVALQEQREKQGLFVLGSARSGTSILTKCLNRSPEIFMLEEPNFFQNEHVRDFVPFFNRMHVELGNAPYKGTYVPPPVFAEAGPLGLLDRLCRQYRYVGEKVAVGPHDYPVDWKRLYLDFHAKHFLRSHHLLTLRRPNEALWSMHKLFPLSPIHRLVEAWLESLAIIFDVYQVCPNSHLLFFDDFGAAALERIAELLGVGLHMPETMLGGSHIRSRLKERELPAPLLSHAGLCLDCFELFQQLRENVCRESFAYCGTQPDWHFFDSMHRRLRELLQRARASVEPQRSAA